MLTARSLLTQVQVRLRLPLLPLVLFVSGCASGARTAERSAPPSHAEGRWAASAMAEEATRPLVAPAPAPETRAPLGAKTTVAEAKDGDRDFPADDVRTAMRAAAGGLRSCGDAEAHTFQAALRIEPNGHVSRVDVSPKDGASAECIRGRLAELTVPAFSGDSVTVLMPVSLSAR